MSDTLVLLRRIANGDEAAFCDLYMTKYSQLISFAHCILGRRQFEAEDVLNDAFVAVWKNADKFSAQGSADGWLKHIVRNKAVDLLRKRYDEPTDSNFISERADLEAFDAQTASIKFGEYTRNELFDAMLRLSLEHREALYLFYFEELSLNTISEVCDCSQNTVKTRLFYGKKKLKEILLEINATKAIELEPDV